MGLRLLYVRPVLDPADSRRVGVVVAERVVAQPQGIRSGVAEGRLEVAGSVPVNVRPYDAAAADVGAVFSGPDGKPLLTAQITDQSVRDARQAWRARTSSIVLVLLAITLIASIPHHLRRAASSSRRVAFGAQVRAGLVVVALLVFARVLLWMAPTWQWTDQIFHTAAIGPILRTTLRSPIDFLFTMAALAGLLALAFALVEEARRRIHRRPTTSTGRARTGFVVAQLGAGALVALLLVSYEGLLGNAIAATSVDALHFSLHPFVSARLAFAVGLILAQAVVFWAAVACVLALTLAWRTGRASGTALLRLVLQALPVLSIALFPRVIGAAPSTVPAGPTVLAGVSCLALAWAMSWARPRYRHASQTLRLFAGALVLLIPSFVLYPSVHHFADRGLRRLVEEEYARQALDQRAQLLKTLSTVLQQVDASATFDFVQRTARSNPSDAAFSIWSKTALASERLASSFMLRAVSWRADSRSTSRLTGPLRNGGRSRRASGKSSKKHPRSDRASAVSFTPAAASARAPRRPPRVGRSSST
jgi:hypothetical protein